jgi:hypothetical protein
VAHYASGPFDDSNTNSDDPLITCLYQSGDTSADKTRESCSIRLFQCSRSAARSAFALAITGASIM